MREKSRAGIELTAAVVLLAAVALAGLYLKARPGPTPIDRTVLAAFPFVRHSGFLVAVTRLGSPFVVVAAAVAGFLATVSRHRARAVALLIGPLVAVGLCDWVIKPVVGRTFSDVVSFPSGTVTAVAAIATVGLLATPDPWRSIMAAFGGTLTVLTVVSVIALRWHYPTDAAAGLATGVGVVLLTDCAARGLARRLAPRAREPVFVDVGTGPDAGRSATG
ncbi:MAG: phosphatase PAP2 family protein [Acidimicrobiales bacterium]|jgi:membrane-associated phospholipid phosphatase